MIQLTVTSVTAQLDLLCELPLDMDMLSLTGGCCHFLCQAVISVTVFPAFVLSKSKRPWFSAAMRVAIQHSGWCQCEPLTSQRTTEGWRFLSVAVAWILRLLCLCRAKVQIKQVALQSLMMRRTSSTRSATSRSAISCAFPSSTGWVFFLEQFNVKNITAHLLLQELVNCKWNAVDKFVVWFFFFDCWTGARIRLSFACCLAWSALSFFLMQNLEKIKRIYCGCLCWQRCTRSWRTRVWVRCCAASLKEASVIGKTFPRIPWLGVWSFAQDVGIWQRSLLESGVPVVSTSSMTTRLMTCWPRMDADCI